MSSTQSPRPSTEPYMATANTTPPLSNIENGKAAANGYVQTTEAHLPAFGGQFQTAAYPPPPPPRSFGDPTPMGLCAFALGCFVLGLIQMQVRNITTPNILVGLAYGYGGIIMTLAGMWELAIGKTFEATVMCSYGGFWLSTGIIFTPGGFNIMETLMQADGGKLTMYYDSFGIFLMGWFIFTTLMLLCTLKATFSFFFLFFIVDIGVLLLGLGYLVRDANDMPNFTVIKAGGVFLLLSSFGAWYNAMAFMTNKSNSFWSLPVYHFPWSEYGQQLRRQQKEALGVQA